MPSAADFNCEFPDATSVGLLPVRNHDPADIHADVLTYSSGTVRALDVKTRAVPYAGDAYIPRCPWRSLPSSSLSGLVVTSDPGAVPRCGIARFDARLIKRLQSVVELPRGGFNGTSQSQGHFLPRPAYRDLADYVCGRFNAVEPPIEHTGLWDVPGLETITVNPKLGKFMGMHLDTWEGPTFEDRDKARTRICLNLGPANRSFLFVPLTLRSMARAIFQAGGARQMPRPHEVTPAFFAMFPDFPVFKLTLEPGDAYIADTDNLIHDASSADVSEPAFNYTLRGCFGFHRS